VGGGVEPAAEIRRRIAGGRKFGKMKRQTGPAEAGRYRHRNSESRRCGISLFWFFLWFSRAARRLACSPFLAARANVCPDKCRSWRFSNETLFAHAFSVFQSEIDHSITVDLDFAYPTEFVLAFFHCVTFRGDIRIVVNATVHQVREFCGNRVDSHMSANAANRGLSRRRLAF
jgi:hypothetical protein